jgi:hypothetical protein
MKINDILRLDDWQLFLYYVGNELPKSFEDEIFKELKLRGYTDEMDRIVIDRFERNS